MSVPVTALYAALLALVAIVLQQLVGQVRLRTGVALYDGGNPELAVAIRRHANFTEHVPLALLLLAILELNGSSPLWLHGLGGALLVSRLIHPFGVHFEVMRRPARFAGAAGTVLVTLIAAALAGWQGITGL